MMDRKAIAMLLVVMVLAGKLPGGAGWSCIG
jgi:hypothetical protein